MSFILLGTMIMLNLFTGVIISSMEEAQDEARSGTLDQKLADSGFLTLHDELALLSTQLQRISEQTASLQQRAASSQAPEIGQSPQVNSTQK